MRIPRHHIYRQDHDCARNSLSYILAYLLVSSLLNVVYSDGNVCYKCDNVAHPKDCNTIAQCGPHEVCNVEQLTTRSGIIFYKTGCVSKQFCPVSGRKRDPNSIICRECCHQDFCNKIQCDTSGVNVIEKRCLHCNDVGHPLDCKNVIRCGKDSMCYAEETLNLGSKRYKLGCKSKQACTAMNIRIFGRDLEKRGSLCHECCNTENCNRNLCGAANTSVQSTKCKDTISICPQYGKTLCQAQYITWARQNCASYCGICSSSSSVTKTTATPSLVTQPHNQNTQSTCKDNITICSQYGKTLCQAQYITWARQNCASYCGVCSIMNGGWSNWGSYGSCSKTCGSGMKSRSRSCNNPTPSGGGSQCPGSSTSSTSCNTQHCPINGGFTSWGSWSSCSKTCGTGIQSKSRTCTNPTTKYGGTSCSGSTKITQHCTTKSCPIVVNGGWSNWGSYGSCSKTCGSGTKSRSRSCNNPTPSGGGSQCPGSSTSSTSCNTQHCPINGGFSSWGSWGSCSKTCGTGTQSKSRTCTNPTPKYGGSSCSGSTKITQHCTTKRCPIVVNGGWSNWGSYGSCSRTCGSGTKSKSRLCNNPTPSGGGSHCPGSSTSSTSCNTQHCLINGGFSSWGAWGSCSKTCGTGIQSKSRTCTNPTPKYGGTSCSGSTTITQHCTTKSCPIVVNGGWSNWGSYGSCSKTCGSGTKSKSRLCNNPTPSGGGSHCPGSSTSSTSCNTQHCPINGGFTSWGSWGFCSKTCGTGIQSKSRTCTNPTPKYGGNSCSGSTTTTQQCNTHSCPIIVNGGWSNWGSYGSCSKSCGSGTQSRSRSCNNPTPSGGGYSCSGSSTSSTSCNTQHCPIISRCGTGWTEHEGVCYIMIKERKTWSDALAHCRSLRGTLAEGSTSSKNNFLRKLMSTDHSACKYCWLGGHKSNGHWGWLSAGRFSYEDWDAKEPDNKHHTEYCLEMGYWVSYHWNDQECSERRNFICQK